MLDEPLTGLSLQALDLDALSSSHHWSIRPCSARFALVADSSSFSTSPTSSSSPRSAPSSSSPAVAHHSPRPSKAVDPRIMLGLDWVVGEVGSRVYYGSQNQVQPAAVAAAPNSS